MTKQKSDAIFSITLEDFLESHLGEEHSRPIAAHLAETIEVIGRNRCQCHVQWSSLDGSKLRLPILWRYRYWVDSCEKWQIARAKSEAERIERHIFDANVKRIAKELMKQLNMDEDHAIPSAFMILKNGRTGAIRLLGVKLIKDASEL